MSTTHRNFQAFSFSGCGDVVKDTVPDIVPEVRLGEVAVVEGAEKREGGDGCGDVVPVQLLVE